MATSRVLVIEDDDATRAVLAESLSHLGLDVVAVDDASQAPDLISQQRFNLLLLDLYMPGMNGFELLRQIRHGRLPGVGPQCATSEAVPVIVVSGESEEASIANAKRLGASAYLVKPVDMDELMTSVKKLLRESSRRRS